MATELNARFEPGYGPATDGAQWVLGCIGADLLVTASRELPEAEAFFWLGTPLERIHIGSIDGAACELRVWPADTELPPELRKGHFRGLWGGYPHAVMEAVNRGVQLAAWLAEHKFCSACGHGLVTQASEPSRKCPACGTLAYPRISPVAIVLILRGEEMLLGRSPHFQPGMYSALAGFVEAGESLEACAVREVREEVGVEINNLRWFGSQSWPSPHSLMLGFIADYAGGELRPQPGEIEDARWFHRGALPLLPPPSSIAYRMIRAVLEGRYAPV